MRVSVEAAALGSALAAALAALPERPAGYVFLVGHEDGMAVAIASGLVPETGH